MLDAIHTELQSLTQEFYTCLQAKTAQLHSHLWISISSN